jgi:uncharacterized protein YcnI
MELAGMKSVAVGLMLTLTVSMVFTAASAHVTVWPKTSSTGAYEKYTVRVPTEGAVATTSIELAIPPEVSFIAIGVAVGHTYELKKSAGRVVGIVWSMRINPGEFAEFAFVARNPKEGQELVWKAVQRFADGTVTEWSGARSSKQPASTTTLSGTGGQSH